MSRLQSALVFETGFSAYAGYKAPNASFDETTPGSPSATIDLFTNVSGMFKGSSLVPSIANTAQKFAELPGGVTGPAAGSPKQPGVATALIGSAIIPGLCYMDLFGDFYIQFGIAGTISWCSFALTYQAV